MEETYYRKKFVEFLAGGKKAHFVRKETILRTDVSQLIGYYFIKSGFVKVVSYTSSGNERIHYIYGPTDIFPIGWSFTRPYMTVAFVAMSGVSVLKRTMKEYDDFMRSEPFLITGIIPDIINMQLKSNDRIYNLNLDNAEARVAHELLNFAIRFGVQHGEQVTIDFPLTVQELADSVRLSRESTGKILNNLEERGYIILGRRRILVYQDKLSKMLEGL
ncbi:MAG: nitric oxide -responding transcriptional regulator NnrR [Candidatus Saccharibacteria bacterium]|nr:nitric oxide -responding transcriptional regulator NnrR [Candidatus Saccharibacteria bacterium]